MKKLYINNYKNFIICDEFEICFNVFFKFFELFNKDKYFFFSNEIDFKIIDLMNFRDEYRIFLREWLRINFLFYLDLSLDELEIIVLNIRIIYRSFDELFVYLNFYKKFELVVDVFYVYDIS